MFILSVCHPEIDSPSYRCARVNVTTNGLQSRIHLHKAEAHEPILSPLLGADIFDFTMCNPPFYSSREEVERSTTGKEFSPSAVCTGADTEMITQGGESAFVRQMVTESLTYRTKCRSVLVLVCFALVCRLLCNPQMVHVHAWETLFADGSCKVAKRTCSTLTPTFLNSASLTMPQVDNYAITEFVQGKTRRWAIGWSFGDERLPDVSFLSPKIRMSTDGKTRAYPEFPISHFAVSCPLTTPSATHSALRAGKMRPRD